MIISDVIQLVIALATSVGVIGALVSVVLSNKSSIRTLALMEKERTATYRGTLYSKQLDTYDEVLNCVTSARNSLARAELSMRYGPISMKLSDLLANTPLQSEEDKAKDDEQVLQEIIDKANDTLEIILYKRQIWAGVLPDKTLQAVNNFVIKYTTLFEKIINYRRNESEELSNQLTGVYDQVVQSIRDEIQIEALRQQTLDTIGQNIRQQANEAKSGIIGNKSTDSRH